MKGKSLQKNCFLLVENRLEKFDKKLSSYFLLYFEKLLLVNYSYLDW